MAFAVNPWYVEIICSGPTCSSRYLPYTEMNSATPHSTISTCIVERGVNKLPEGWRVVLIERGRFEERAYFCPRCMEKVKADGDFICWKCHKYGLASIREDGWCTLCANEKHFGHWK